jgi:hypothetical protein
MRIVQAIQSNTVPTQIIKQLVKDDPSQESCCEEPEEVEKLACGEKACVNNDDCADNLICVTTDDEDNSGNPVKYCANKTTKKLVKTIQVKKAVVRSQKTNPLTSRLMNPPKNQLMSQLTSLPKSQLVRSLQMTKKIKELSQRLIVMRVAKPMLTVATLATFVTTGNVVSMSIQPTLSANCPMVKLSSFDQSKCQLKVALLIGSTMLKPA